MSGNGFGARLLTVGRDPWILLLAGFGGGAAWAFGLSIAVSAATAGAMFGAAVLVAAPTPSAKDRSGQLRPGTRQEQLIAVLDGHLRSLTRLHTARLPDVARNKARDALDAAAGARLLAVQVAVAVDALDEAISAARKVPGLSGRAAESINNTVGRLDTRRSLLLDRLTVTVDEVATVYAGLREFRSPRARWLSRWTTPR